VEIVRIAGGTTIRKTANTVGRRFLKAAVAVAFAYAATATSLEKEKPAPREYVGSKKCRVCHNSSLRGKIYGIWSKEKHARAYRTLLTPEAKEVGKELGIDEPQRSGECLRCHATAYGLTKKRVTKNVTVEEGVGCESCHGPGKEYSRINIMKDRQKAVAAGLIDPPKNVCTMCHNPESPTWNPERYTDKKGNKTGFDFEVSWEMIKHYMPKE